MILMTRVGRRYHAALTESNSGVGTQELTRAGSEVMIGVND